MITMSGGCTVGTWSVTVTSPIPTSPCWVQQQIRYASLFTSAGNTRQYFLAYFCRNPVGVHRVGAGQSLRLGETHDEIQIVDTPGPSKNMQGFQFSGVKCALEFSTFFALPREAVTSGRLQDRNW